MNKMFDIDIIIPAWADDVTLHRCVGSLANQWRKENIHITIVDDCSPNTKNHYQSVVDRYKDEVDVRCITTPKNVGQGLARQYGIDHTDRKFFMFMDNDDCMNPLAVSIFLGALEGHYAKKTEDGGFVLDDDGQIVIDEDVLELSFISGSLEEFDPHHFKKIPSQNRIWLNSKVYNREFIKKHGLAFDEVHSHRAEDYCFMSQFFWCVDHDPEYTGILLDDQIALYNWWPDDKSRSRSDEHYGHRLSGYTMDASVTILDFIKSCKTVEWTDEMENEYRDKVLNMTAYSYYTFLSYVKRFAETDFESNAYEWDMLRDACKDLNERTRSYWEDFSYERKQDELFIIRHNTDCQCVPAWISFDEYIEHGTAELEWSYDELMNCKNTYKFTEDGKLIV